MSESAEERPGRLRFVFNPNGYQPSHAERCVWHPSRKDAGRGLMTDLHQRVNQMAKSMAVEMHCRDHQITLP
jgi:hypothetical protein